MCLVNRLGSLRSYVDELEDAILEYDKKVYDLQAELDKEVELNQVLSLVAQCSAARDTVGTATPFYDLCSAKLRCHPPPNKKTGATVPF